MSDAPLRPDLSATADVVVESRRGVVGVPIIALTIRDKEQDSTDEAPGSGGTESEDVEGVFVVTEGTVSFTPVEIGIAGQEYFEILSGLAAGDTVVAGPYQRIRQLRDGDAIRDSEDTSANN
jgi:HlyD family secretion protein